MAYYNKLKDKLRKSEDLPIDMSWEEMSDGIFQKMGKKEKKRRIVFWWFVPTLIVSIFLGYYLLISANEPNIKVNEKDGGKEEKGQNIIATQNNTLKYNPLDNANTNSRDMNNSIKTEQIKKRVQLKSSIIKAPNLLSLREINYNSKGVVAVKLADTNPSKKETESGEIIDPIINNVTTTTTTTNDIINVALIPNLGQQNIRSNSEMSIFDLRVKTIIPLEKERRTYLGFREMSISSGVIFLEMGSDANFKLNTEYHKAVVSEKELVGYHIALHKEVRISKHFLLKTSLDYQKWYSEFYYSGTKMNIKEVDNIIVKVEENLLTGEKILIRGTASINETVDRTLRHRNEQNSVFLSLSPVYLWEHNKWAFNTSVGLFFSIYKFGKGKTLWNDQIVAYEGIIPQYNAKMQMGYLTSLNAKYVINNRYYAQSMIGYHKFISNINAENSNSKPTIFSFSIGLGLHL